jgi:predicted DsbA family dithiol-disulfide isomerase
MGVIHVAYFTDPACPWSWAAEPALRRLQVEFGDQARITYVMGGLAREFPRPLGELPDLLDAMAATGVPGDPRLWLDRPPSSSYPACQGVKAAAEQRLDGPYLRVLREGFMIDRRALDTAPALVDAARTVPGMDVARFEIDLRSHATAEAFAADLDRTRTTAPEQHGDRGRVPFPSFAVRGEDGVTHGVWGDHDPSALRAAALAAGGAAGPLPGVEEAVRRLGRAGTSEIAAVCDLPRPRAAAELWRLAADWRIRHEPVLCGELWSAA